MALGHIVVIQLTVANGKISAFCEKKVGYNNTPFDKDVLNRTRREIKGSNA